MLRIKWHVMCMMRTAQAERICCNLVYCRQMPDQLKYLKRIYHDTCMNFGVGCISRILTHTHTNIRLPHINYIIMNYTKQVYMYTIRKLYGNRHKFSFWVTVSHIIYFLFLQVWSVKLCICFAQCIAYCCKFYILIESYS